MIPLVAAIVILVASGIAALIAGRRPRLALWAGATGAVAASVLGLAPVLAALRGHPALALELAWPVPGGALSLGLDALSAFFLVPVLVLGAACAVYGLSYMRAYAGRRSLGPAVLFFNVMLAALVLVLVARHALVFLVGWELMTLASFLLVTFEHHETQVRRAGWTYLIASHVGVASLVALFLTLGRHAGSLSFAAFAAHAPAGGTLGLAVFALALAGFGVKAGIVPLHVWLPEAHAAAPSHVSALMSGALIKLGIYGLLRTLSLLSPAAWHGPVLMALGTGTGLVGISLAVYQRDIKRTLAYSSIENVGIILLGLGVGLWGAAGGRAGVAALGIYGALLHLWNHAAMKGLMFLAAGSIAHGAGTRDLERLGGLLRPMPWTGSLMIVGAVAIAGLPPLGGFVSEWLIYAGLLQGGLAAGSGAGLLLLFVAAGLATIGVLAALCFVRLIGIALLGQPRSPAAAAARESPAGLVAPLLALASAVVAMAFGARALVPLLGPVAAIVAGRPLEPGVAVARLDSVILMNAALIGASLAAACTLVLLVRRRSAVSDTWGCGYLAPTARMQYTGHSFVETMAARLMPRPLRVRVTATRPASPFPSPGRLASDTTDPFTRAVYEPFFDRWGRRFARLRWLQQGALHAYLVYILVAVVAALVWASTRRWWQGL